LKSEFIGPKSDGGAAGFVVFMFRLGVMVCLSDARSRAEERLQNYVSKHQYEAAVAKP